MAFIHVETFDPVISEDSKHPYSSDPENHFLTEPVMPITAVKIMSQRSVPFGIFGKIGIQEVDRNLIAIASNAWDLVLPGTQLDGPSLDRDRGSYGHLFQKVINDPLTGLLSLPSILFEPLVEVTLPVKQGNGNHRNFKISG
jgi:hypothetical protein